MKRSIAVSLVVIIAITSLPIFKITTDAKASSRGSAIAEVCGEYLAADYREYLDFHGYSGELAEEVISVNIDEFYTDGIKVQKCDGFIRTDELGSVTWKFSAKTAGFYQIKVGYSADEEGSADIVRSVSIDGKVPYEGLSQQTFPRIFDNNMAQKIQMVGGNEIRSESVEVFEWNDYFLTDPDYNSLIPYVVYLSQGEHIITFETLKEPLLKIKSIEFCSKAAPVQYQSVKADYEKNIYSGENITYQAERCSENVLGIYKSSLSIEALTDYTSAYTVPYHPYRTRLNTFGGSRWQTPGETVTWKIDVPEDASYAISFRCRQTANRDLVSYRSIAVNGEIPYKEAQAVVFGYSSSFVNYTVEVDGEPALFKLKKGENTITMQVVMGEMAAPIAEISEAISNLNVLYREIVQITGVSPDKFVDYDVCEKVDKLSDRMKSESNRLNGVIDYINELTGDKGSLTALIEKTAIQTEEIAEDPDTVIEQISTLKSNISSLGTWIIDASGMPLEVDSFTLYNPESELKKAEPNFFVRFYYGMIRFFVSFISDGGFNIEEGIETDEILVWMPSGRDQVNILKGMIDSDFASDTNTKINLQLVPATIVLPATLSGNGPDVVLNMPYDSTVNFAMRSAVYDLSKFKDFKEVASRYSDGGLKTTYYQGGYYAIPEQQTFCVMFCRNDILKSLNLEPPKTWDEFRIVLSALNSQNYDVYVSGIELYQSLVYQYGGDLYSGEGKDYGIETGLSSESSMNAFKDLTKLFTTYSIPVVSDFANRFRSGEMPIGIANYTIYNTLELFAPEIKGLWSIYELPGIVSEDGKINNTCLTYTNGTILMSHCKNKDVAWEFIKWWNSESSQYSYAVQLEALLGTSGRYPAANASVTEKLNWETTSLNALKQQFKKTVAMPVVPGNYMTSRMISNAYNEVVTDDNSINPKEALYLRIKQINDEITKKRKEFGLSYKENGKYYEGE